MNPPCSSGGTPHITLEDALTAADATGERDRVEIGAGILLTNASDASGNDVDIVGSGRGVTFLDSATPATSNAVLTMSEASSTLSDLTIRLPAGDSKLGLQTSATSQRIEVTAGATSGTAGSATGVILSGNAVIRDSRVALPVGPTFAVAMASAPLAAQTATVEDTVLEGQLALEMAGGGTTNVRRASVPNTNQGIRAGAGTLNVSSSVVRTGGVFSRAFIAPTNICGASPSLNIRHVTAVEDGGSNSPGITAFSGTSAGQSSNVTVRDSIVRGFETDLRRERTGGVAANLTVSYSDYATATELGTGTLTEGPGSLNVDPAFVNPGAGDYRLSPGSPVVDIGDPAPLDSWNSTLDLGRLARVADGNEDGGVRSDMGAHERQPPAPPGGGPAATPPLDVAPVVSSFSVSNRVFRVGRASTPLSAQRRRRPVGTRFRFRLSEAARVAIAIERKLSGVRVRVRGKLRCLPRTRANLRRPGHKSRCSLYKRSGTLRRSRPAGAGSVVFSGRLGRRALKPGSYRATIVATDPGGKRSGAKRLAFRIVKR